MAWTPATTRALLTGESAFLGSNMLIINASVMPTITAASSNAAAALMIGEQGSEPVLRSSLAPYCLIGSVTFGPVI
jgi:hypothetical protein